MNARLYNVLQVSENTQQFVTFIFVGQTTRNIKLQKLFKKTCFGTTKVFRIPKFTIVCVKGDKIEKIKVR